ncbi:MAG: hypothetical protein FWD26_02855 [Treponema sp.]|nr:hypothetical protein [Treponema sp.]
MKKLFILFLVFVPLALFGQEGQTLTTGRTATLGVEASTTFGWDIEKGSTGLDTRAGLELVFDLFPAEDRGTFAEFPDTPTVRFLLKDAAFTWWNTYATRGGNYEQDDFNRWTARPLILTFDVFMADVVWRNYFFRIASSTTTMQMSTTSLRSIFDEVMDAGDRFYYRENQALWRTDRYNIQRLPIMGNRLNRNLVNVDYSGNISGILAGGMEFKHFGFTVKAASADIGRDNEHNAWLFGADLEIATIEHLKIDVTGFAAVNYEKVLGENPVTFGVAAEYQLPLTDKFILNPYLGFDFMYDTVGGVSKWEIGTGILFYTRGFDTRTSYRLLDFDDVIPVGASLGFNVNEEGIMNIVLSWFDPAGRDSLIENFGGFLQLELVNLFSQGSRTMDFAILTHLEYSIKEKVTPYIRAGYKPQISGGTKTDNMVFTAAIGCYITPIHFFSFDVRYQMEHVLTPNDFLADKGMLSAMFTIRM